MILLLVAVFRNDQVLWRTWFQKELQEFKEKSIERAKKAGDDIRAIEESMRRIKEKEKGKAKALQKAERERQCAYDCSGLYSDAYHVVCFTSYSPAAGPV